MERVSLEGQFIVFTRKDRCNKIQISQIKAIHVVRPILFQKVFSQNVYLYFITYQLESQTLVRSHSLGLRGENELKKIIEEIGEEVPVVRSVSIFF